MANYTYKVASRKNEFGEWVVKAYRDGKRYPDGDYYAADKDDAIQTAKTLARDAALNDEWDRTAEPMI